MRVTGNDSKNVPRGYSVYGTVFGRRFYSGTDLVIASSPAPAYGIASQYRPPDPLIVLVRCRLGSSKTKYGPNCNFFAIRDCFGAAKQGYRLEIAVNRPQNGLFSLCGNRRESLIEKKLQRSRNFCFYKGRTDPAGQTLRKTRGAQRILRKTRVIAVTATRQVSAKEISSSSLFSRHCPLFLAIQIRGLRQ